MDIALNVYRIVSELVQNIGKHAHANRAAVQLLYHADYLTVTVDDDGIGSQAVKTVGESAGIGLKTVICGQNTSERNYGARSAKAAP